MPDLLIAAIGFSLAQVLLSLLLLVRQGRWGVRERLFGLLMVAILGYLMMPLAAGTAWAPVMTTVQTLAPGMFWLFSASVFDDQFRLRNWQLGLVGFTVVMPALGSMLGAAGSGLRWLFFSLPQGLEFLLLGLTLWVVSRHWRTDLVESRRRLRLWFVGINGSFIFILILAREVLFPGAAWLATWEHVATGVMLLGINLALLDYRAAALFNPAPQQAPGAAAGMAARDEAMAPAAGELPAEVEPALVARLREYMEDSRPWREMGLTIGQLAEQLGTPQYRLRQAINAGLGYRNFSDFLNSYRIREATGRLANPEEKQLPVLTIAMDAGFRSLSSFNKAFKDTHGVTPTAWRRQALEAGG